MLKTARSIDRAPSQKGQCSEAGLDGVRHTIRGLAMRFNGILRGRNSKALDEWIDDAIDTELMAIMRFASEVRMNRKNQELCC